MKKDLFGFETQGTKYDEFRPKYPKNFLLKALEKVKNKNRYLDIATGTGQILFQIADHFLESKGVDFSQKMINVCETKIKKIQSPNISFQQCDFTKWNSEHKYDLITIGQALHWFPIQESLIKMNDLLAEDGILTIYGYIFTGIKDSTGQPKEEFNKIYDNFYTNKVKKYFDFDRDELHNHYSQQERYPFDKLFKNQKYVEEVSFKMSKEHLIGYFKTFSGYNTYLEKEKDDPIKQIEQKLTDSEVTCVFDYFMIICYKK